MEERERAKVGGNQGKFGGGVARETKPWNFIPDFFFSPYCSGCWILFLWLIMNFSEHLFTKLNTNMEDSQRFLFLSIFSFPPSQPHLPLQYPNHPPDVLHAYYGLCGLSAIGEDDIPPVFFPLGISQRAADSLPPCPPAPSS